MLRRTEGIVLRTIPFGEADLIVTYLTGDFGLIRVFAKSPRKIKSRFGSSLEPLTHSTISFWGKEDTALPKLTQSDIIHPFKSIRESLESFLRASEIIEITLNFIPERDENRNVYSLLLNILKALENQDNPKILVNHFKIQFLRLVGFAPKLDSCGRCSRSGNSFYLSHGSVLCERCARGIDSPVKISAAVLKLFSDLATWETLKVHRIKPSDILLSQLSDIINMHIKYILSKPLKSEVFSSLISR